jgi:hypothetical protein
VRKIPRRPRESLIATAILDDIKDVTSTVRQETSRIDGIIRSIVDAVGRWRRHAPEHPRTKAS